MNLNMTMAVNELLEAHIRLKQKSERNPKIINFFRPSTSDRNPQNIGVITIPAYVMAFNVPLSCNDNFKSHSALIKMYDIAEELAIHEKQHGIATSNNR
jgi:hypothetical protein